MHKDKLANLAVGVLTCCAVVVTALLVRRELFPPKPATEPTISTVSNWHEYVSGGQRMGPVTAPVTLIEFSDFQCPFCRLLESRIDSVRKLYPNEVSVVYRNDPIEEIHPFAHAAALAAECAGAQHHFEAYYRILYTKQDSIGKLPWTHFAALAQVPDTATFSRCVRDSSFAPLVRSDVQAATRLGVQGTPGLLINSQFVHGAPSQAELLELVTHAFPSTSRSRQ